ncbi:BPTI/Kunitz domain-containing protein-like [Paroedura picta]|uniref:BPTI/Kunitz domain-containing protein-like n=1 Tax=Paroedura picta TaxID=143630 RepID=UPI00405663B9
MTPLSRSRHDALLPGGALLLLLLLLLLLVGRVQSLSIAEEPDPYDVCLQPKQGGLCKRKNRRWYYDRYTQHCRGFNYGGCDANANNFRTLNECASLCHRIHYVKYSCRLPSDPGPCDGSFKSYFYDLKKRGCYPFTYGGCKGNLNRFKTKNACLKYCDPDRLPEDDILLESSLPE